MKGAIKQADLARLIKGAATGYGVAPERLKLVLRLDGAAEVRIIPETSGKSEGDDWEDLVK